VPVKTPHFFISRLLPLILIALLSSCGSKQPLPTEEDRQEARLKVPCIVVLPVETRVNSDPSISYKKASVLEDGAAYMDSVLAEQMVGKKNIRVLSSRQFLSLIPQDSADKLVLMKKIGSELKCNAVLETTLSSYRQRVGSSYGVDSPASVAFSFRLFDTSDGRVIWSSTFKETQQTVMSNIMSLGSGESRGLKWLTVEELAELGITEQIKECPYL
jgi:hypothetical protein